MTFELKVPPRKILKSIGISMSAAIVTILLPYLADFGIDDSTELGSLLTAMFATIVAYIVERRDESRKQGDPTPPRLYDPPDAA